MAIERVSKYVKENYDVDLTKMDMHQLLQEYKNLNELEKLIKKWKEETRDYILDLILNKGHTLPKYAKLVETLKTKVADKEKLKQIILEQPELIEYVNISPSSKMPKEEKERLVMEHVLEYYKTYTLKV